MMFNNEVFFLLKIQKMRKTLFAEEKKIQCRLISLSKYCLHSVLLAIKTGKVVTIYLHSALPFSSARNTSMMSVWR